MMGDNCPYSLMEFSLALTVLALIARLPLTNANWRASFSMVMFIFFIAVDYSVLYGGASICFRPSPSGWSIERNALPTPQRSIEIQPLLGSKTQADLLTLFFGEFQTTCISLGMPLVEIEISILFDISFQRRITYQKYLLSR